jgi:hypothetical protein
MQDLPYSPAAERNRQPILEALTPWLTRSRTVLEIGSGTGQHATHLAAGLPQLRWQASELADRLPGLRARFALEPLPNLPDPIALDVALGPWPQGPFDTVFTANTVHIMPWHATVAMLRTLPTITTTDALLAIYGPFNDAGQATSESNAQFDQALRAAAAHQGLRDFQAVDALAAEHGFHLQHAHVMPANNLLRIYRRDPISPD